MDVVELLKSLRISLLHLILDFIDRFLVWDKLVPPGKHCGPDEEQDPVPDEGNGDIVGDKEGDDAEDQACDD